MPERAEENVVTVEFMKLHDDAKIPYRKRSTDAGYDLYAYGDFELLPNSTISVNTGICISCPPGYYYTIEGRSSLWSKGIFPNRGIIDATYTGEIFISMVNITASSYFVKSGDRIAQIILARQYHFDFKEVDNFSPEYSLRGQLGFGSSGR